MKDYILKDKAAQIDKLYYLVEQALTNREKDIVNIDFSPTIDTNMVQQLQYPTDILAIQEILNQLKEKLPSEFQEIELIEQELSSIEHSSPQDVKTSSAMHKLRKFIEELSNTATEIGKAASLIKGGES